MIMGVQNIRRHAERYLEHAAAALERLEQPAVLDGPQVEGAVEGAGRDVLAVGGEGHGVHRVRVLGQGVHRHAALHVPQLHGRVERGAARP